MDIKLSLKSELSVIVLCLLLTLASAVLPGMPVAVQSVLSLILILLLPGFTLQSLFFPRADALDGIERFGLAFGLSIAIVPPLALLLDYLPVDISPLPIIIGESLLIVIIALLSIGVRARLPKHERFLIAFQVGSVSWWATQNQGNRLIYLIVIVALMIAGFASLALTTLSRPSAQLTEFYIVADDGLAEGYFVPGEEFVTVRVGIHNREGITTSYRIVVQQMEMTLLEVGDIHLEPDQEHEQAIRLPQERLDQHSPLRWLLYRNEEPAPYRMLRLWLNGSS